MLWVSYTGLAYPRRTHFVPGFHTEPVKIFQEQSHPGGAQEENFVQEGRFQYVLSYCPPIRMHWPCEALHLIQLLE
jgi:hypothetical protein